MNFAPLLQRLSATTPTSGAALAAALQVSRAAVWKQIEQLRALGLEIEAQAGRGYRLSSPLQLLDAAHIRAAISNGALRDRLQLQIEPVLASTSGRLLKQATSLPSASVLLAEAQTAGRGQRGRSWISPFASGILGSCLWHFDRGLASLSGLSLALGVAVAEALAAFGIAVQLKWPNDVLVAGRKLGGLLIDAGGESHGPCHVVVGLGLNGRLSAAARLRIDQPATDIESSFGRQLDRNRLAAGLIEHLIAALSEFAEHGFAAFQSRFQTFDALTGREVTVQLGGLSEHGQAQGVDASGRLLVSVDGVLRSLDVGEVRVREVQP